MNRVEQDHFLNGWIWCLFYCRVANLNICYGEVDGCMNTEQLSAFLTPSPQWAAHYAGLGNSTKSWVVVVFWEEPDSSFLEIFTETFKLDKITWDVSQILSHIEELSTHELNCNKHSCVWCNQEIFSHLIDRCFGGCVDYMPSHWGRPTYVKERSFDFSPHVCRAMKKPIDNFLKKGGCTTHMYEFLKTK